jgi:hypothetical protein
MACSSAENMNGEALAGGTCDRTTERTDNLDSQLSTYLFLLSWKKTQTPNRTNSVLSGAGLAHFEGFFHEAPPEWRLKVGRGTTLSE